MIFILLSTFYDTHRNGWRIKLERSIFINSLL